MKSVPLKMLLALAFWGSLQAPAMATVIYQVKNVYGDGSSVTFDLTFNTQYIQNSYTTADFSAGRFLSENFSTTWLPSVFNYTQTSTNFSGYYTGQTFQPSDITSLERYLVYTATATATDAGYPGPTYEDYLTQGLATHYALGYESGTYNAYVAGSSIQLISGTNAPAPAPTPAPTTVPEPSPLALLVAGAVAGLPFARRRRRARRSAHTTDA